MLQERLANDQYQAVNHYVIEQQLRNRKFIHDAMTRSLKKTIASADNTHCVETPVEYNITDSMLNKEAGFLLVTYQSYSEPLENTPIGNCLLLDTPSPLLGRGPPRRGGGGVWIFSGTTHLRVDKVLVSKSKQKHVDIDNIYRIYEIPGRSFRGKT